MLDNIENHFLFSHLGEEAFSEFESRLKRVDLAGGEVLFEDGDEADSIFFVISGRLRAYTMQDREMKVIGEIAHGEFVGEMAIITGEPRSAMICAVRDSELAELSKSDFDDLLEKYPHAMQHITRLIVKRLQRTIQGQFPKKRPTTIAVVALMEDTRVAHFAEKLAKGFGQVGSVLHINPDRLKELSSDIPSERDTEYQRKLKRVLCEWENHYNYVIYEAVHGSYSWTDRCLRQADRIILVADANKPPAFPERLRDLLFAQRDITRAGIELALLYHQESQKPSGAAAWLELADFDYHHHVRMFQPSDFARVARILAGRAWGLVLGGGGARGFAHIGVLRAFEESGIPIDMLGGTSMGAVIAGQYAMGFKPAEILERTRAQFVDHSILDFTLPIMALTKGRKFSRMGHNLYGEIKIEDLWLNYYCMTTNLTRAQSSIHRRGTLWKWVRGSTAVPGLVPPFFSQSEAFVDGGLLNNLPMDVMLDMGRGPVCGVNVSPLEDLSVNIPDGQQLSPWKIGWDILNPFAKPSHKAPTMLDILVRTSTISSVSSQADLKDRVELYLSPPIEGIGMLDWKAYKRAEEIGYRHALEAINDWRNKTPTDWPEDP